MPRKAIKILLTDEQKARLEKITRSHSAERRLVERAGIILACAAGKQNQEIAADQGMSVARVSKWRRRFAEHGFAGLEDEQRPGQPAIYGQAFRDRLLAKLDTQPPTGLARWDCQTLAEDLGASKHAVWRALKKEGIHLHRARSWCVSTDPEFTEKSAVIIGLYLNPPLNALVLSVDEKPGIQALERETGYVETRDQQTVRVQFHFTPTSASWLNQIEIWFGILSRKTLKGASFTSAAELKSAIEAFIVRHNQKAQPFKWRRREVKGSQIKNTIANLRN